MLTIVEAYQLRQSKQDELEGWRGFVSAITAAVPDNTDGSSAVRVQISVTDNVITIPLPALMSILSEMHGICEDIEDEIAKLDDLRIRINEDEED